MDQLKYIKIQNADSTWSGRIPISHNPSQIFFSDNENLQTKITNIENELDTTKASTEESIQKISIQAWGYAAKAEKLSYNVFITTPNQKSNEFQLQDGVIIAISFHDAKPQNREQLTFNLYVNRILDKEGEGKKYLNLPVVAPTYKTDPESYFTLTVPRIDRGEVVTFIYSGTEKSFVYLSSNRAFDKGLSFRSLLNEIDVDSIYLMDRDDSVPKDEDGNPIGTETNWPDSNIKYFIVETRIASYDTQGTRIQRAWTTSGILYSRTQVMSNGSALWSSWKREFLKSEFDTFKTNDFDSLKTDYETFKNTGASNLITNTLKPSWYQKRQYYQGESDETGFGFLYTVRKSGNVVALTIRNNSYDVIPYHYNSESPKILFNLREAYRPTSADRTFMTFLTANHYGLVTITQSGDVYFDNIKRVETAQNEDIPTSAYLRVNVEYVQ